MTPQTMLYFTSILLTCILTGFLAWYAWKHQQVPAARAYMRLTLSEYFFALAEILSVLSPSSATALFWFQVRYIAGAFMGVFWFVFALEYSGHREWLSKRLLAGLFVIPFVTQVLLWSNPLHGLWIKQEAGFTQNGIFWIADITTRIPGLGYLTHTFYTLLLTLAGIALMFLTAWKMRRELLGQALMLAGAGLIALTFAMNPLFNFLPKTGFNPFTPGIGLSVLLIALSVFRFEFLKRAPAQGDVLHVTRFNAQEKRSLAIFIFIFIVLASAIAAASTLIYQNYEKQFRTQVENQLSAIAALKVDELHNWRDERLADASLFYRNENFSERVRKYLEDPQDTEARIKLLTWMEKIQLHPEYTRVFLLNPQGIELISLPEASKAIPEDLIQQVSACLASGEISFLDFHRHADKDIIHLSILIPIFDAQDDKRPLGVLVLLIDPNVYHYPFIQQWPVPSQSAETLLVRREGETVLYLNELRFEQGTALTRRFPLSNTDLPAVKAVLGETGIVEGMDYRGRAVIADIRSVPGSSWFLVSKMDTAEVYAPLRERLWQTILFFGLLVLASGAGLTLVWRQGQVNTYRAQVEAAEALRSSEEKFRLAFDTSPDSVAITRARDGMFVSVNKGFEQISGYSREQAIGKTSLEINIWKDPEDRRKIVERLRARGEVRNYEAPFLTRDGEIYGLMSATIIELNGEPHILNITRDISERKQAEVMLIDSETRDRRLFEAARDGILILDAETGMILEVNQFMIDLLGFSREVFLGRNLWELGFFKDIAANKANFLELQQKEYIRYENLPLETANGQRIQVEFVSNVYLVDHHKIVQCNIRDITERKRAEEARRESEELFRQVYEYMEVGVARVSLDFRIQSANEAYCRMLGYSEAELVGVHLGDITHPEVLEENLRKQAQLAAGEIDHYRMEKRFIHRDGHVVYGILDSSLIRDAQGKPGYFLGSVLDISERKRAEEQISKLNAELEQRVIERTAQLRTANTQLESELVERRRAQDATREVEERFRRLSEAAFEAIIIHDGGILLSTNNQYCEMFGYELEELLGKQVMTLTIAPDSMETVKREIAAGGMGPYEAIGQKKDGTRFPMEVRVRMMEYKGRKARVAAIMDITERKRTMEALVQRTAQLEAAQEQLVRQERLAMLGQLAGSIGHELRNPLGVISNAVYFLKMSQPDADDRVKEYLDIIESETRTSDKIVTDLLDFTRIKSLDREPASVSELIRQTLERYPVPPSVKVAIELPADLPRVYADPQHIIQVLGNLTVNACQAMDNTGNLSLSARAQGDMIIIAVQDTGMGIPTENMIKVFEPLFTTKTKGIGLGLAVSRKLAEANGGRIELQSEPDKGSTFTLVLPVFVVGS